MLPNVAEIKFATIVAIMIFLELTFLRVFIKNADSKIIISNSEMATNGRPLSQKPAKEKGITDITLAKATKSRDLLFLKPKIQKIGISVNRVSNSDRPKFLVRNEREKRIKPTSQQYLYEPPKLLSVPKRYWHLGLPLRVRSPQSVLVIGPKGSLREKEHSFSTLPRGQCLAVRYSGFTISAQTKLLNNKKERRKT